MFGRRRSLAEASSLDSNSIGNDTRYSSALYTSKTGDPGHSLARSSTLPHAASADSSEWEPSRRERLSGFRSSLSTRPLLRKPAHKHTPPPPPPPLKSDNYFENNVDYTSSSLAASTPRPDLRTDFARAAGAPERPTNSPLPISASRQTSFPTNLAMPSHGSVSSGTTLRASPSLLGSAAADEFEDDELVKHARFSRLNASTYHSPPSAARTRVMSSQSMYAPTKPLTYTSSLSPSSRRNRSSTLYDDQNHSQQPQHLQHHHQLQQQQSQQQQQPLRLRSALSPLPSRASLASPNTTTTTTLHNAPPSSPKQRSGVWDELENVKERLNRLKVSSPASGRRGSLDNTAPAHMDLHYPTTSHVSLHKSNSLSGASFSHSSLGHHPVQTHVMDPPQSASNLLSVTRAPPPASPTQAARHLRDVLARVQQQSCQDVNVLLLERAARDVLALYDDPSGPDPRGIDQACLSLGSYIMQTLDTTAATTAAATVATASIETPAPAPLPPANASPVLGRDLDSPRRAGLGVRRYGATGPTSNKRHSLTFM